MQEGAIDEPVWDIPIVTPEAIKPDDIETRPASASNTQHARVDPITRAQDQAMVNARYGRRVHDYRR